jgi:hypothetical protein
MRTQTLVSTLVMAAAVAVAAPAEARHVHFLGPHPIAAKYGGGYCYIESPHLHVYAPEHNALFQQVGDQYVFTGDPTPFGYEGDKHTFYGHHPLVVVNGEPVICLIDGPHFHGFAPPETPDFQVKGDVAFYVGPPLQVKPGRVKLVNAEYRPYLAQRPVVTVEPPPEYHADVVIGVPQPPSVRIEAPAPPSVHVEVPAPPSVVFSAPAPPAVYVEPPHPHVTFGVSAPGVVVAAPPGVVVEGGYEVHGKWKHHDDEGWGHHDNGRHLGWGKHGR